MGRMLTRQRALMTHTKLRAGRDRAGRLDIAGDLCIYTSRN
ncbi:MAG: hypothetical protein U0792_13725 [Gemmataceae bacterium]